MLPALRLLIIVHAARIIARRYQGLYNALCRTAEYELLPALRSLGMAFYAYSPLAGGLLANSTSAARAGYRSGMLSDLGVPDADEEDSAAAGLQKREVFAQGMDRLEAAVASAAGGAGTSSAGSTDGSSQQQRPLELKDAALRWFFHHSQLCQGDAVVIGSSRLEQVEEILSSLSESLTTGLLPPAAPVGAEEPLPAGVVVALDMLWEGLRGMPYYPNQPGAPTLQQQQNNPAVAAAPRL